MLGDRFNRSWVVAKQSYAVLKGNPSLAFFPMMSGIATVFASIPFAAFMFLSRHLIEAHSHLTPVHYVVMAATSFVNYFIIIFFNAGLVACANENLQGRPATVGFGINAALQRLPQILVWTAIASTVGLVLRLIGERLGIVGQIVIGILGFAWNIAVFFVVPVLVIDRESPFAAIKTSTSMLKRTWGERLILGFGVSVVIGVLALLVLIPLGVAIALIATGLWFLSAIFFICAVMFILILAVAGSAMGTIYQTALYLYCRHGVVTGGFNEGTMQGAFKVKPQNRITGMFSR